MVDQFGQALRGHGLRKPWYWDTFKESLDVLPPHGLRQRVHLPRRRSGSTSWCPGPHERAWLRQKYPRSWRELDPVWEQITQRWKAADPGQRLRGARHGHRDLLPSVPAGVVATAPPRATRPWSSSTRASGAFFAPSRAAGSSSNSPNAMPRTRTWWRGCWPGEAPANLVALVKNYFGLDHHSWGKDAYGGEYPFVDRGDR